MAQQRSKKGKGSYATYKTENRAEKNKIKKLERHCKRFPDDETAKKNLERIKKSGYTCRSKPTVPNSNPTVPNIRLSGVAHIPTPGEQLSKLLGIPLPKPRSRVKPVVKHKPRRK